MVANASMTISTMAFFTHGTPVSLSRGQSVFQPPRLKRPSSRLARSNLRTQERKLEEVCIDA